MSSFKMPHKRQSRVVENPKNSAIRRLHCPQTAPPNVIVESTNGVDADLPQPFVNTLSKEVLEAARSAVKKLTAPGYNTTVRTKAEMDTIKNLQVIAALSPSTMAAIAPKVTQKLNFQMGDTVFKNLEPLNVNDSVLIPQKKSSRPANSKVKQPELKLADYLENIRLIEMAIPEPELKLEFAREPFDFIGAYMKIFH